jgi:hypothetical protein
MSTVVSPKLAILGAPPQVCADLLEVDHSLQDWIYHSLAFLTACMRGICWPLPGPWHIALILGSIEADYQHLCTFHLFLGCHKQHSRLLSSSLADHRISAACDHVFGRPPDSLY